MLLLVLLLICRFSLVTANCYSENSDGGILQTPTFATVQSGGSVSIRCLITMESEIYGVNVIRHFRRIMYINSENVVSREPDYEQRVFVSGSSRNFTVTLTNLTESDSDIYLCNAAVKQFQKDPCGDGTLIFVLSGDQCTSTSKEHEQSRAFPLLPILLTVIVFLCLPLLLLAIYKIYKRIQLKTALQKLPRNSLYVDMTQTRRNTMSNSYTCSTALRV